MGKSVLGFICGLLAFPLWGAGKWTAYMSYSDVTKNTVIGNKVYTLASGSMFIYDTDTHKARTLDKATGLSDTDISFSLYNKTLESFLLIYSNFNIDILGTDNHITNLPQYKNSNLQDKTINNVSIVEKEAYLSTSFGVVVINMERGEIANTYDLGTAVVSATATEKSIYAVTSQGTYEGNKEKNLLDKSIWTLLTKHSPKALLSFDSDLYALEDNGLYSFDESDGNMRLVKAGQFSYVNSEEDVLLLGNAEEIVLLSPDGTVKEWTLPNDFSWTSYDGSSFWASAGGEGLQQLAVEGEKLSLHESPVSINSPVRNLCYFLRYTPSYRLLVGGGSHNYFNKYYPGTVMTFDTDGWTNFSEDSVTSVVPIGFHNVTAVAEDPQDNTHHFVSAACGGLFEYKDGKFVHLYDNGNSPISSILPNDQFWKYYTRTSGINYDSQGNLWIMNNEVDTIIRILKPDGSWGKYYIPALAGYPTFDKIYFDSRGWVWITHRRKTSSHEAGILCIDTNGTLDDKSDDQYRFQYNFDGNDDINQVYDVAEDRDGILWIATSQGPFILRDPGTFFSSGTSFERIIVPRNDGTNLGDYLLDGISVTDIEIDGGNRKWFATSDNGVYLVSADGLTVIHHFTKENSPLLSNTVYSIAVNGNTGEVMFGTDAGLVSYRSDATTPEETINSNSLKAYPNPVRPEYQGNVTVTGFSYNSDVKVTSVGGQLVYKGTSVGGTFTWNGRTNTGKRVSPGVYYIIGSDENRKKGASIKVLVM